ncbi:MAG: DNA phosphorothioation-associated putative methyltransferase [Pseudomonadota bacterium]
MTQVERQIERHRTAMHRTALSRPVSMAIGDGVLSPEKSVFDYGCGRGVDIRLLGARGYDVAGWDPHFAPDEACHAADVVTLGYVLNVIEDQAERTKALKAAYELAEETLIVAVRIDRTLQSEIAFEDGCVSQADTFQKIYTQSEIRDYLQAVLGKRPHIAGFGVAYVFKDEGAESAFLERRAYGAHASVRMDLFDAFKNDEAAKAYVALFESLGRHPVAEEFESLDELTSFYGSLDRVRKFAALCADIERLQASGETAKSDVLTLLASVRLRGMSFPALKSLSERVRADIRASFGGYAAAKDEATAFLFSIGDRDAIAQAIKQCDFGKVLPDDFYVHNSLESELPPLLRLLVFAAKNIVGSVGYNVLKIRRSGRAVSFLTYEDFDGQAHPKLKSSVVCYLPKADYSLRSYEASANRPILHRKDALVDSTYPLFGEFRRLTEEEEELGLLSSSSIGFEDQWRQTLAARHVEIVGHSLKTALHQSGEDSIE